jgi:DNA-nicking Smr family endonuclease
MKTRAEKRPAAAPRQWGDSSDTEAFARAMADVVRLRPDPRGRVRTAPRLSAPPATKKSATDQGDDEEPGQDFAAPGVDRHEIRKLKRGEHVVGERCDLHGMTAEEACLSVGQFLERSRRNGHRCVCIVHGRGLHSKAGIAVLKTRVREYLRRHRSVLAYVDAPRADGGAGAVYVLLRK